MTYNPRFYEKLSRYNKDVIINKYRANGTITEKDEQLIREFLGELVSQRHTGQHRIIKLAGELALWRRFINKEYKDLSIQEVYGGIERLKTGKNYRGKPFKQNSIRDYILSLRQFLLWMSDNQKTRIPEKKISGLKLPSRDYDTTTPEELPTPEEIRTIIKGCQKSLHSAFMAVLYESGCRLGELNRLTWADAVFEMVEDCNTVKLYIDDFKTKKHRYSRLVMATEYLAKYKNDYEAKYGAVKPEDFIFVGRNKQPFTYAGAVQVFERMIERSKIQKHLTPHDFRRARATHLIQQNYQESIIKKSLWGNLNTPQFQVYAKLADKDIDKEFLAKSGIKKKEERINPLGPRPCGQCPYVNLATDNFCAKCGYPLTQEVAASKQAADNYMELKPEYQEIMRDVEARLRERQKNKR